MYEKNPPGMGEERVPCNPGGNNGLEEMPLAMVYSPKQYWRMTYAPDEALKHGTLFEELYKPIMTANGTGGETE